MVLDLKQMKAFGIRPNLVKQEFEGYSLKGQTVFDSKRGYGGLNPHYYEAEIERAKKSLEMTFFQYFQNTVDSCVVDEEEDIYGVRDDYLLDVYQSNLVESYKKMKRYERKRMERAEEILQLIKLTRKMKHVKGVSNTGLIVFDLERENGEWEE